VSKTNHRRQYKGNTDDRAEYAVNYTGYEVPDGGPPETTYATLVHGTRCNQRERAGAKKYIHSRTRRRVRDWIDAEGWEEAE